jgi:SanA protein
LLSDEIPQIKAARRPGGLWLSAGLPIAIFLSMLIGIYFYVEYGDYKIYEDVALVPKAPAAVVFGAGIDSREARDRVSTAAALYKHGIVQKLLMTGDNGHLNYNEPEAMKRDAVALGVPAQDIVCDYAGFRTYDSVYRAHYIFEVEDAVLVTQRYHLPRALFLAKNLGLKAVGIDAGVHKYGIWQTWYNLREIGAAEAAWLDIMTCRNPKFLGKKEPLFAPRIEAAQEGTPQPDGPR